ncbi:DNA mismatch repair protein Msh3-like [Schistocerca gregaria]|uniref:DNA mismatch repair protein Msh3-like n=1 Tax=Schistocerca gregaria TaxID=7010 RepID=UPI00211E79C9|nr:DNA mismatch repair protein Msh3-like [Schistocerca gregaria]
MVGLKLAALITCVRLPSSPTGGAVHEQSVSSSGSETDTKKSKEPKRPSIAYKRRRSAGSSDEDWTPEIHKEEENREKDGDSCPRKRVVAKEADDEREKLEIADLCQRYEDLRHEKFAKKLLQKFEEQTNVLEIQEQDSEPEEVDRSQPCRNKDKPVYTPLEQQYLEIKAKNPDVVLFVETGYQYKFFGKDAEIASQILDIRAGWSHNFLCTSVPIHRLYVHAMRLVQAGYKVGVVSQTETAALKTIGKNKSGPFSRALTTVFTKSTISNEMEGLFGKQGNEMEPCLMAIFETALTGEKNVKISIASVKTATGDVTYDTFEDDMMRRQLETRLEHMQPVEVVMSSSTSRETQNLVTFLTCTMRSKEDSARIELLEDGYFEQSEAEQLFEGQAAEDHFWTSCSSHLKCCFGALLKYLKVFELDGLLRSSYNFKCFTSEEYMRLDGNALVNLELIQSRSGQGTNKNQGSLMSIMDHTSTNFGRRLLTSWIRRPLRDGQKIRERQEAIEMISEVMSQSEGGGRRGRFGALLELLQKLPDLERGICRIYNKKCRVPEFLLVLNSFSKVERNLPASEELEGMRSELVRSILRSIPSDFAGHINFFLDMVNQDAKDYEDIFVDDLSFPALRKTKNDIRAIEESLEEHLEEIRRTLSLKDLVYVTRQKEEYLIELTNAQSRRVPDSWRSFSGTKTLKRYRTEYVQKQLQELMLARERLTIESKAAWMSCLTNFSQRYHMLLQVVNALATLDCLRSLAILAEQKGYVKPVVVNTESDQEAQIVIKSGRHPVVETLLFDRSFIPNDTVMGTASHRCMIITGPNMGGKTCYIKQVAIICIMAQIGSFVPAEQATISPLDSIYTRMGSYDNMLRGHSTFFIELRETSDILEETTSRSLVILDELGRGTSSHDGLAIAYSVLYHLVQSIRCFTLFVTHYPECSQLTRAYPNLVQNYHIAYLHDRSTQKDETRLVLLHKLARGVEDRSYGLNVAHLAHLPPGLIEKAREKSTHLELKTKEKMQMKNLKNLCAIGPDTPNWLETVRELHFRIRANIKGK